MTLQRVMLLGALAMLASGFAVYTLTTPGVVPHAASSEPAPDPVPSETDPAPIPTSPAPSTSPTSPTPSTSRQVPSPAPEPTSARTARPRSTTAVPDGEAKSVVALLQVLASQEAAGMVPDGAPIVGRIAQGRALSQDVTLYPGKCYTALGAALFNGEIDVALIGVVPGYPPAVIASDRLIGAAASAGGRGACVRWAYATSPGQIVIKAAKGGGVVAGQLFVR